MDPSFHPRHIGCVPAEQVLIKPGGDGSLVLRLRASVYKITPWPAMEVFRLQDNRFAMNIDVPWVRRFFLQLLQAARLSDDQRRRLTVYDFLRPIPLDLHARLVPMMSFYFAGADLCGTVPEAREVFAAKHGLGAALASRWIEQPAPAAFAEICRRKHREIAKFAGLPGTEAACRILRKMSWTGLTPGQWRRLARRIHDQPGAPGTRGVLELHDSSASG